MKKVLVIFMVLLLAFSLSAYAKKVKKAVEADADEGETVMVENCISTNAPVWLGGLFNFGYERKIVDHVSVKVRGAYWALSGLINEEGVIDGFVAGYVGGDVLIYPAGTALEGWAVGAKYDMWFISFKALDSAGGPQVSGQLHFLGFEAAHKWVFDTGFSMSLAIAGSANIAASAQADNDSWSGDTPLAGLFLPSLDFELGYAF